MWLNLIEASKHAQRSPFTIKDWASKGLVGTIRRDGQRLYDSDSLDRAKEAMIANYQNRRIVPGSGRGKWKSKMEPLF